MDKFTWFVMALTICINAYNTRCNWLLYDQLRREDDQRAKMRKEHPDV